MASIIDFVCVCARIVCAQDLLTSISAADPTALLSSELDCGGHASGDLHLYHESGKRLRTWSDLLSTVAGGQRGVVLVPHWRPFIFAPQTVGHVVRLPHVPTADGEHQPYEYVQHCKYYYCTQRCTYCWWCEHQVAHNSHWHVHPRTTATSSIALRLVALAP
jgi:hypothetical protein